MERTPELTLTNDVVAMLCERAADRITPENWVTGTYCASRHELFTDHGIRSKSDRHCAIGHLAIVTAEFLGLEAPGVRASWTTHVEVLDVVLSQETRMKVESFNDNGTYMHARALLRMLAEVLRGEREDISRPTKEQYTPEEIDTT